MKKIFTILSLIATSYVSNAQTQYINDPSFELTGAGGTQWQDTDYHFTRTLVNNNNQAHTGSYSSYLEAVATELNQARISQTFLAATTTYNNKLEFYIKCIASSGSSTDVVLATLDFSKQLYLITGLKSDSASIGSDYKKITVIVDTITAGLHTLDINCISAVLCSDRNVYIIDDVTLTTGAPTSIDDAFTNSNAIKVLPTITKDEIHITNTNKQKTTASIYNVMGQLLLVSDVQPSHAIISIGNLPASSYVFVLTNSNGEVLNKTIITKQ
jgi:hypothetical protein